MANKYWYGTVNASWNNANNWQNGLGSTVSFPTSVDDVFFTTNNNISCNVASACNSIIFGTYSGLYTATNILQINGPTLSLSPNMTFAGTSLLQCMTNSTLTSNGKTLGIGLTLAAGASYTLTDTFAVSLTTTMQGSTTLNGGTLSCNGSIVPGTGQSAIQQGTTVLLIRGNWSGNGQLRLNTIINPISTSTFTGNISFNSNTLKYTGTGSVVNTAATLVISSGSTVDTYGINWTNLTLSANATHTLSSTLSCTSFTIGNQITFTGSAGFIVNNLNINSNGAYTFKTSNIYTINNSFISISGTNAARTVIRSDTSGIKSTLILTQGATSQVGYTNAIDIDSSSGRTINSFMGTFSNSNNWRQFSDSQTISSILL